MITETMITETGGEPVPTTVHDTLWRDQLSAAEWLITESVFDPSTANTAETLFTVGNGYLGTRGTLEEGHRGELSGTYLAGVYDRHDAAVIDLVNAPDWLALEVTVAGVRLDVQTCTVVSHERVLDLRQGLLWRCTVFCDASGRRTRLESLRLASMADRHVCALRVAVTPENHGAPVVISSALDGYRRNLDRLPVFAPGTVLHPEVRWQKWASSRHLQQVGAGTEGDSISLAMETIDSAIVLAYAAATEADREPVRSGTETCYEAVAQRAEFELVAGQTLVVDKLVTIYTSRDGDGDSEVPAARARDALAAVRATGFDDVLSASRAAWAELWADCDCRVDGDPDATRALRFSIHQLLIAANPDDPTVNIGAKSLTGEGYRGHVFWDTEVLMLPFFIYTQPATALSLLRYRHHTLPGARELAAEGGLRGARYPWESADTGREECPVSTNDGLHRFWTRDEEIHVSADVAYGVLTYVAATGDQDFLLDYGAEILFETSRFWVDRSELDPATGRYSLKQVMGPDEFHSHVDDNAFTNRLAQWNLTEAARVHHDLAEHYPHTLDMISKSIGLEPHEVTRWRAVADALAYRVDPDRPVIEQFTGYFDRLDVPISSYDDNLMPRYPDGYHHFNCEETMLLKQPDVIMLMHMLPDDFDLATKKANFEFYEARTLHKSSLSPAVHAIMGIEVGDSARALEYFRRSAFVDLTDNQGNTHEGVHIASAGGTWQILVVGFGGFRVRQHQLTFDPWLPPEWEAIHFRLQWRGHAVDVSISHLEATFTYLAPAGDTEVILVAGHPVGLTAGAPCTVPLTSSALAVETPRKDR